MKEFNRLSNAYNSSPNRYYISYASSRFINIFVIYCFSSINEEPAEAQPSREAIGPSSKRAKYFFAYLKKKIKGQIQNEAELFLYYPSDSMAQLENHPTIEKMYRCDQWNFKDSSL